MNVRQTVKMRITTRVQRRDFAIWLTALWMGAGFAQSWASVDTPLHVDQEARSAQPRKVVLLHGLVRNPGSMQKLAKTLAAAGHRTCNVAYPSRRYTIEELTLTHVRPAITACFGTDPGPLDFVTHSLGGIIVRQLAATGDSITIGRVVMLSPPNQGSQIVDKLGHWGLFKLINGPAGNQLGTDPAQLPHTLGPAGFELGVITGNRSINWILSLLIPGDDDGKVSIENAKLEGMRDFLVVPSTHTFIMKSRAVQAQVLHFLAHGCFQEV